jgi:hypothetical protein
MPKKKFEVFRCEGVLARAESCPFQQNTYFCHHIISYYYEHYQRTYIPIY